MRLKKKEEKRHPHAKIRLSIRVHVRHAYASVAANTSFFFFHLCVSFVIYLLFYF